MSFSVELWNGYDLIYNNFLLHRRGLKDFIYLMTQKHDYELECAKGMKKIYETNYAVSTMETLANGILGFKTDLLNQFNYAIEFVNSLREEIIEPLKVMHNEQTSIGTKFNSEMKRIEREYKDSVDRMEKFRVQFHSCAKLAEESKLRSELAKINLALTHEQKMKLELKSQATLKEAKEYEWSYVSSLNIANNNREVYIDTMKRLLNEFQILEEKLGETIKDSLRKYVIYQVAFIRNLQYDVEKKANIMESINVKADIQTFIDTNATNELPPYKFEFIPYTSEYEGKSLQESDVFSPEVVKNVSNFISNVFFQEPPNNDTDSSDSKCNSEIEVLVNSAWEGNDIIDDWKKILRKYMRVRKYRRYILQCLNQYRLNGLFTLNEKSYANIGEMLRYCLDEVLSEKDYEAAKICMNLSQTLYKAATEPNMPRVFLQTYVESHYIWKRFDFWEEFIRYGINEEMHNQKNYNIYTFEKQEEKKKRIKGIVFTQLTSFLYNMLSFDLQAEKVREMILNFSKYYDLEDDKIQELMNTIQDYIVLNEKKAKEEQSTNDDLSVMSSQCKISSEIEVDSSSEDKK